MGRVMLAIIGFPKVRATSLDLIELDIRMTSRKADLLARRS
jgi:hypothetical protein